MGQLKLEVYSTKSSGTFYHHKFLKFYTFLVANCGTPPMPGGQTVVDFTTNTYLSVVIYFCSDSCYQLVPNMNTLVCQADQQWSPTSAPECQCKC